MAGRGNGRSGRGGAAGGRGTPGRGQRVVALQGKKPTGQGQKPAGRAEPKTLHERFSALASAAPNKRQVATVQRTTDKRFAKVQAKRVASLPAPKQPAGAAKAKPKPRAVPVGGAKKGARGAAKKPGKKAAPKPTPKPKATQQALDAELDSYMQTAPAPEAAAAMAE